MLEHQDANMADLPAQRKDITDMMLQTRREMAYDAFRTSLAEPAQERRKAPVQR